MSRKAKATMRVTRITMAAIILTVATGLYLVARMQLEELEPRTFQATEEAMVDAANVIAAIAETTLEQDGSFDDLHSAFVKTNSRTLKADIYEHLKTEVGLQCYITDSHGTVIFDSDGGQLVGHDMSQFNDVHRTLAGRYGARSSRIVKDDSDTSIMHVAAPIFLDGKIAGVLTLRKAQSDVLPIVQRRRASILWGTALVGTGILCMLLAVFIWQYRPIARLTEYTRQIEQGKRPARPKLGAGQEVNTLANALESMRDSLEGRKFAERYVQTLTHEMKSPVAAIAGAAELLDESMPEADRKRFLENIRAESARASRLLDRLLELSAIEGRSHLDHAETIDFRDIVSRAVDQAKPIAALAQVQLTTELPASPVTVHGDPFILRAAVTNLLENAIDFSPANQSVVITLSSAGTLSIDDNGPGIPDYARDKVFDRFFSLRHLTSGRKGTGLGLTLVREAVTLHGGTVALEPRDPTGTRAKLTLPTR